MAPEVINGESVNDKSIDWWALGITIYEFILGSPPFLVKFIIIIKLMKYIINQGRTREEVFESIKEGEIEWPEIGKFTFYIMSIFIYNINQVMKKIKLLQNVKT